MAAMTYLFTLGVLGYAGYCFLVRKSRPVFRIRYHIARPAAASTLLCLALVLVYASELWVSRSMASDRFELLFQLRPDGSNWAWALITNVMAHATLPHLAINLLGLVALGWWIELRLGWRAFLGFFFAAGALTSALQVLATGTTALGASGALTAFFGYWTARPPPIEWTRPLIGGKPVKPRFIMLVIQALFGLTFILYAMLFLYARSQGFVDVDPGDGIRAGEIAHLTGFSVGVFWALADRLPLLKARRTHPNPVPHDS